MEATTVVQCDAWFIAEKWRDEYPDKNIEDRQCNLPSGHTGMHQCTQPKVRRRVTLTGAQVTRVFEALSRYDDNLDTNGMHITVEDLVNDILDVVRAGC